MTQEKPKTWKEQTGAKLERSDKISADELIAYLEAHLDLEEVFKGTGILRRDGGDTNEKSFYRGSV